MMRLLFSETARHLPDCEWREGWHGFEPLITAPRRRDG
jgi:hypothetical protein